MNDADTGAAGRERLSALIDGELDAAALAQFCGRWRDDEPARATWHAYHLIGDVMRSDDLAQSPARDAAFLAGLRSRLANEPVVLAPRPLEAARSEPGARGGVGAVRGWRRAWMAPTAVAAGFVAVAGVLTLTRPGVLPEPVPARSIAQAPASAAALAGLQAPIAEPQIIIANGELIRDARLDRYLFAHKQFAGSSALGVPSAYLRNATAEVSGR